MKTATKSSALFAAAALVALGAAGRWWTAVPAPLSSNQVLALLPLGSSVHSLVRLEMDGRRPAETAVVARIPAFPGSSDLNPVALLYRYDHLRRRFAAVYRVATPGAVPFSVDAARLLGGRDAAVFSGLDDDGMLRYRVIGLLRDRPAVMREAEVRGSIHLLEPLLVERRGSSVQALRWVDGVWKAADAPSEIPAAPPTVIWRYTVRRGMLVARSSVVRLRPRQPLRILATGGGGTTIVLPDQRFDVVESGYRQREPGTYTVRIVTGFDPPDVAYRLTVIVEP